MEDRLNLTESLLYSKDEEDIKIAITHLAFKNGKIINLLRTRGDYIKKEKWDKISEIEAEIN